MMPDTGLVITGMAEAQAVLKAYVDAARENATTLGWSVVATAPYASKIESGKDRNGRVARKAGPLHFMRDAVNEVTQGGRTQEAMLAGLPSGPQALRGVRQKLANDVAKAARRKTDPFPYSPRTRRHTKGLSLSIHVVNGTTGGTVTAPLIPMVGRTRATVRQMAMVR